MVPRPPRAQIRPGTVLEQNGKLLQVVRVNHVNQGRQLGSIGMELRDIVAGTKHLTKFRPSESLETVRLESRRFSCLYREDSLLHAMDLESYEQVAVDVALFGDRAAYLAEGLEISLALHDGRIVTGDVPAQITLEVREAAPTMKGETSAPSYKPATLENGVRVQVPPFIAAGDRVVIDTREGTFQKRA